MRMRLLASSSVVPLLFAGCSGGGEPSTDSTPTSLPPMSSSVSSSDTASARAEAPEDFVRRWVDVSNAMYLTGDTTRFRALGRSCPDCDRIAATVDRIYSAGGEVQWEGWTIRSFEREGRPGTHAYRYLVDSAPTRYRESSSGPWMSLGGGRSVQLIVLEPDGSSWQVVESKELPR